MDPECLKLSAVGGVEEFCFNISTLEFPLRKYQGSNSRWLTVRSHAHNQGLGPFDLNENTGGSGSELEYTYITYRHGETYGT